MGLLLQVLQNYGFDHHTRVIANMYAELIVADLPSTIAYFNSRMVTTTYSEAITEGIVEGDFSVCTAHVAPNMPEFEKKLFGKSKEDLKAEIGE